MSHPERQSGSVPSGDEDFSRRFPRILDEEGRRRKAEKILAVLREHLGDLTALRLLDIGCAGGQITHRLGEQVRQAVGLDVDEHALALARREAAPNVSFVRADGTRLPFGDGEFDLVVCNHVYEHVESAERLLAEIRRVLRPGGVCYFAAANRLMPIEAHYRLPLLSWLPKPLADRYVRLAGRGTAYPERHLSYFGLRRLVRGFAITDYTGRILEDPERFASEDMLPAGSLIRRLAPVLYRAAPWISPSYVWLLTKQG